MKLHQEASGALNTITSYGADYVAINLQRHEGSIIVMPETPVIAWPVSSFEALTDSIIYKLYRDGVGV